MNRSGSTSKRPWLPLLALALALGWSADALAAGKMYWTVPGNSTKGPNDLIQRAGLDGSGVETVFIGEFFAFHGIALDLDAGAMFWTESFEGRIRRAGLDGSNVQTVLQGLGTPWGIALGGGKIYWVESGAGVDRIRRANLDGSGGEELLSLPPFSFPIGIALDLSAGKMYWSESQDQRIARADLDGSNVEVLVTGATFRAIALDPEGGKMYWSEQQGKIRRSDLDGSDAEDLLTAVVNPTGVALDLTNDKIYFVAVGQFGEVPETIERADLDGSDREVLVENEFGIGIANLALDLVGVPPEQVPALSGPAMLLAVLSLLATTTAVILKRRRATAVEFGQPGSLASRHSGRSGVKD